MTYPQALHIAILAISREQRQHVFIASLARYGMGSITGQRELVKWKKLEEAKQILSLEEAKLLSQEKLL